MTRSGWIPAIALTLLCSAPVAAIQSSDLSVSDSGSVHILELTSGISLLGSIAAVDDSVTFRTDLGTFRIHPSGIESIRRAAPAEMRGGQYLPTPNATRLFFAPTGRCLRRGQAYVADYYLFFPAVTVGLTDRVTLGGGISLIPEAGLDEQLYYITPKVALRQSDRVNIAAGALIMGIPDADVGALGILYGVGTYGSLHDNLTVGFGFGFVGGNLAEKPMVMIGGEKRIGRRTSFITENWILPGVEGAIFSGGVRLFGDRLSVDLGVLAIGGGEAVFPIPYVDFVFPLGR